MALHFVTGNARVIGMLHLIVIDVNSASYVVPNLINGTSVIDV
jgi:hypothetical protein